MPVQGSHLHEILMDSAMPEPTQEELQYWLNLVKLDTTDLKDLPPWLLESTIEKACCDAEFGGRFLLHHAGTGCIDIVQRLLAAGANPNTAVQGITAVFLAACSGQPEVIRILVEAGADADATRGEGVPVGGGKKLGRVGDNPLVAAVCRAFWSA